MKTGVYVKNIIWVTSPLPTVSELCNLTPMTLMHLLMDNIFEFSCPSSWLRVGVLSNTFHLWCVFYYDPVTVCLDFVQMVMDALTSFKKSILLVKWPNSLELYPYRRVLTFLSPTKSPFSSDVSEQPGSLPSSESCLSSPVTLHCWDWSHRWWSGTVCSARLSHIFSPFWGVMEFLSALMTDVSLCEA